MPVNVNTAPLAKFDWAALVDKINSAAPAAEVSSAKYDPTAKNVVFTVGEGDSAKTLAIAVPDLDTPGEIDRTEFDGLLAKLGGDGGLGLTDEQIKEVSASFSELLKTSLPASTGNVMFDLYALMALMLEAAQKQRNAAREIRSAENQAIQNTIRNQAEQQRDSALTGLIAGLAVCVIQVAAQIGSFYVSSKGYGQQKNAMDESGVNAAQKNLSGAKAELKSGEAKLEQMKAIKTAQDNRNALNENGRNPDPAEIAAADKALAKAGKGYSGETPVTDAHITEQEQLVARQKDGVTIAEAAFDQAAQRMNANTDYIDGRHKQDQANFWGGIASTVGGVAQTAIRSGVELQQSETTKEGAKLKQAEEEADQIKDLFMQAQDVVKSVLDLVNAISQAENASMRDAIHA